MTLIPSTVRARVALAATTAIVAVLSLVAWGLVVNHRRELTSSLDERMSVVADHVVAAYVAGAPSRVDSLGEDDWVAQVVVDGEVVAASAPIRSLEMLGPPVDRGQEIRSVGALPGGSDNEFRLLTRAVEAGATTPPDAVVHLAAPTDDVAESVATLRRSLLVAIPIAAAALGMLTWVLVGRTLRPVERIRAEVEAIGGADLHRRVPVPGADDEIGRLAMTMNDMLARLERAQSRQRQFVADASHELRSPLTRMRAELEVDLEHPSTADPEETHRSVLDEVVGLQRLVDDLLRLARSDGPASDRAHESVDVGELAVRAVERARHRDGVVTTVECPGTVTTHGVAAELERALVNLVDNAVRHARAAVRVHVDVDGGRVAVAVEDDGDGVRAADRERIFERFARADPARAAGDGGAGLGLSIARDIVERHGGTLVVDPSALHGARFVVTLPVAGNAA